MKLKGLGLIVLFFFFLTVPTGVSAKTEIIWWHAMTGFLGEKVEEITKKFNNSQTEYEVKAIRKGTYPETLTAGIAAYRAKTHPQIIGISG